MNSYKNYINLIRNLMSFDEFDDVIIRILPKIFDEYYINRFEKNYNIDNLFKKWYLHRYQLLKKKYHVTQNNKLIFRFRKYNTLEYIIKLLKQNVYVFLEQGETYKSVAQEILKFLIFSVMLNLLMKNIEINIHYMNLIINLIGEMIVKKMIR